MSSQLFLMLEQTQDEKVSCGAHGRLCCQPEGFWDAGAGRFQFLLGDKQAAEP